MRVNPPLFEQPANAYQQCDLGTAVGLRKGLVFAMIQIVCSYGDTTYSCVLCGHPLSKLVQETSFTRQRVKAPLAKDLLSTTKPYEFWSSIPRSINKPLTVGRRRRATVLDHDAIPALVIRVGQRAQHTLVRVDAREEEGIRPGVLEVAAQRLRLVPEPRHAIFGALHVLRPDRPRRHERRVDLRVPLARHERPPLAIPEVGAEAVPERRVRRVDQGPREATLHAGRDDG
ncbi:hypothetical protein PG990_012588 [Apiospora arundinis]